MARFSVVAALVVALTLTLAGQVRADDVLDDLNERRAELDRDRRDVNASAEVMALEVDEAIAELDLREQNLARALQAAAESRVAADDAAAEASRSSSSADLASRELSRLRSNAAAVAVERYTGGLDRLALEQVLQGDMFAPATIDVILGSIAGSAQEHEDRVVAAEQVLDDRRNDADALTIAAQDALDEANRLATVAEFRREEYDVFVGELQARLDQLLLEASAIEGFDRELAEQIRARETVLARRLPPRPTYSIDVGAPVGIDETIVVRGFRVNISIAAQVEEMLAAAEIAGLDLGGGGWRDTARQIELRRAHCGPTDYDIYEKPSGQCSPPTARPTRSMHERGLALDLTSNGSLITSRLDPAYQWLLANASRWGFFNLPSEPWHWSLTGG